MKRSPKPPIEEMAVSDGTRSIGHLLAKAGQYEAFDAAGRSLGIAPDIAAARRLILTADRRAA